MNPDEPPPSLSSQAIRSFDQKNLQVGATAGAQTVGVQTNYYQDGTINHGFDDAGVQPMSLSGHFRGLGSSLIYSGAVNRELINSYGSDGGGKPPSMGAVRPFGASLTSGGGNQYASDQAPSFGDVRGLQTSQTGASLTGNQITYAEAEAGMSLTAADFKRIDPNAFQKDN